MDLRDNINQLSALLNPEKVKEVIATGDEVHVGITRDGVRCMITLGWERDDDQ